MNEDVFNAVATRHAARAVRRPGIAAPSIAATTGTTPLDAHAVYVASPAAQDPGAIVLAGRHGGWRAHVTLHSYVPTMLLVSSLDAGMIQEDIYSRVQQYVERCSIQPAGTYYGDQCLFVEWGEASPEAMSAFATENTSRLFAGEWRHAPVAFNRVELVEERDARAQRLFAELQNGVALGRRTVQRLRELEDAANEEGEPFSLDAVEALVMFANAHPDMPLPDLTLSRTGGILAEWRRSSASLTLYFISPINVQYLVKRRNPWHFGLGERSSGTTTVDRVGETLKVLLPSEWPIRA